MAGQGRLWVKLYKGHRVQKDVMLPCERNDPEEALRQLLPKLDLSQPMWLAMHRADWEEYAMTRFRPEHFVDSVDFDYMEISYIFPENEKKSRPRNPLWDA